MKAYWFIRGLPVLIINSDTRWRWVDNFTLRLIYLDVESSEASHTIRIFKNETSMLLQMFLYRIYFTIR
jgi:hypothetical protein